MYVWNRETRLFIYGDYLYYDGMTQIAQLRENVKDDKPEYDAADG